MLILSAVPLNEEPPFSSHTLFAPTLEKPSEMAGFFLLRAVCFGAYSPAIPVTTDHLIITDKKLTRCCPVLSGMRAAYLLRIFAMSQSLFWTC